MALKLSITEKFEAKEENISQIVDFVSRTLTQLKIEKSKKIRTVFKIENVVTAMIQKCNNKESEFTVTIKRHLFNFGKIRILLKCAGDTISIPDLDLDFYTDYCDDASSRFLKNKLTPLLTEGITIKSNYGFNSIGISIQSKELNMVLSNIITIIFGLAFGLLLKYLLPSNISGFICNEIFETVIIIFFNMLKLIIGPVIFCSIVMSVSDFSDIKQLSKIGGKTLALFLMLSIIGLAVGYLVFNIIPCGDAKLVELFNIKSSTATVSASKTAWEGFKNFILSIFPSNIVEPFSKNDFLAIIVLAIVLGFTVGKLPVNDTSKFKSAINTVNNIVYRITEYIIKYMPVITFSSMVCVVLSYNFNEASDLLVYLADLGIAFIVMLVIYGIILAINGINPFKFYKAFSPTLSAAFAYASSSAVIPTSIDCCNNKLKISKSISNFVIPLGSTINMNGSCVCLMITCLFIARCFGVNITTTSNFIYVACMILLLSMSAPGVPVSLIIMLATLLPMMGIPSEAANIMICFSSVVGMAMVPVNCTGDAFVALLINKNQKKHKKHK